MFGWLFPFWFFLVGYVTFDIEIDLKMEHP